MELRLATKTDLWKVKSAIVRKHIPYCTAEQIQKDYDNNCLYVVAENNTPLAITSVIEDSVHGYTALKRGCVLNKKNRRKGIMYFSLMELSKRLHGTIGATPWLENTGARKLLESAGFQLQYVFNEKWCFYAKEI